MTQPHLIAHVVRGEPAFDVAQQIECVVCHNDPHERTLCEECDGVGFWWIIPTSGHRAYPYWNTPIHKCKDGIYLSDEFVSVSFGVPTPPLSHPDHYPTKRAPDAPSLVDLLNLKPKLPTITRRL